ncbi:esterase [Paenibacillus sp. FSL A5-0031]|uniref:alpha/beta hydrolase n=1 Tax=Paenibacillus sp. FSL A5-0031 TaxID=1920420 RepID=UPI00096EF1E2|nr:alpha/beta hydrolase-fold protein [Paenibacillus sp. FSL A5-0031]OME85153.1 esterase [Paenibacillus sp. FSL A5-0031]
MNHFQETTVQNRELTIYLPPSYQNDTKRRYPAAYVQDGGGLFQHVTNQLEHLMLTGKLPEVIMIGIKPHDRNDEYTPWTAPSLLDSYPAFGGKGRAYVDELADVVKPYIDERYRTKTESDHTAIIGGSFGGLISLFAGYWRPDTFGRLGLLSASFWFQDVLPFMREQPGLSDRLRIYMSVGDCEGIYKQNIQRNMVDQTIEASTLLVEKGLPANLLHFELQPGGTHDSLYMSENYLKALKWLFYEEVTTAKSLAVEALSHARWTKEFTIPHTRHLIMCSVRTGREYRIFVWLPQTEPPEDGFSVLYALDGNASFGSLAEAMRLQGRKPHGIEPQVIVAIGYDSDEPIVSPERFYDYTIKASSEELRQRPDGSEWPETGGADDFITFIEEQLKPEIERIVPINRNRQSLFGHSLGGFFALHTLFTKTDAFSTYIAGSPSIWWKQHDLLQRWPSVEGRLKDSELEANLLIVVGAEEKRGMVEDAKQLYELMLPYSGDRFVVSYREVEGAGHISVLPPLINELLKFI